MPRAYSMDLRERLVAAWREERLSQAALAARFRVSGGTVANWLRRVAETGSVAPKPRGGGRQPSVDAAGAEVLRALVREQNDRTLDARRTRNAVPRANGRRAESQRALAHARPTRARAQKKSLSPAEQDRPDVVEARAAFREMVAALRPEDLVFVCSSTRAGSPPASCGATAARRRGSAPWAGRRTAAGRS